MEYIELHTKLDSNGCWIWQGDCDPPPSLPYGILCYKGKKYRTHRAIFTLTKGEIPKGLSVLHECDVPQCCNPTHLFLGTQTDNLNDMYLKGRQNPGTTKGQNHPHSVLTERQVIEILRRFANGAKRIELIREYGCSEGAMDHLLSGRSWKHIPRPDMVDVVW